MPSGCLRLSKSQQRQQPLQDSEGNQPNRPGDHVAVSCLACNGFFPPQSGLSCTGREMVNINVRMFSPRVALDGAGCNLILKYLIVVKALFHQSECRSVCVNNVPRSFSNYLIWPPIVKLWTAQVCVHHATACWGIWFNVEQSGCAELEQTQALHRLIPGVARYIDGHIWIERKPPILWGLK